MADGTIDRHHCIQRAAELVAKTDDALFNRTLQHRIQPDVASAWAELSRAYSELGRALADGETLDVKID